MCDKMKDDTIALLAIAAAGYWFVIKPMQEAGKDVGDAVRGALNDTGASFIESAASPPGSILDIFGKGQQFLQDLLPSPSPATPIPKAVDTPTYAELFSRIPASQVKTTSGSRAASMILGATKNTLSGATGPGAYVTLPWKANYSAYPGIPLYVGSSNPNKVASMNLTTGSRSASYTPAGPLASMMPATPKSSSYHQTNTVGSSNSAQAVRTIPTVVHHGWNAAHTVYDARW